MPERCSSLCKAAVKSMVLGWLFLLHEQALSLAFRSCALENFKGFKYLLQDFLTTPQLAYFLCYYKWITTFISCASHRFVWPKVIITIIHPTYTWFSLITVRVVCSLGLVSGSVLVLSYCLLSLWKLQLGVHLYSLFYLLKKKKKYREGSGCRGTMISNWLHHFETPYRKKYVFVDQLAYLEDLFISVEVGPRLNCLPQAGKKLQSLFIWKKKASIQIEGKPWKREEHYLVVNVTLDNKCGGSFPSFIAGLGVNRGVQHYFSEVLNTSCVCWSLWDLQLLTPCFIHGRLTPHPHLCKAGWEQPPPQRVGSITANAWETSS